MLQKVGLLANLVGHLFAQRLCRMGASSLVDGDDSSVDADADGDHVANLLEFAFGMDPGKSDTGKLPVASQDFSGQNVALTYHVDRAAGGVIVRVEYVELLGQEWKDISLAPFSSQVEILGMEGTVRLVSSFARLTEDCLFACCCRAVVWFHAIS